MSFAWNGLNPLGIDHWLVYASVENRQYAHKYVTMLIHVLSLDLIYEVEMPDMWSLLCKLIVIHCSMLK